MPGRMDGRGIAGVHLRSAGPPGLGPLCDRLNFIEIILIHLQDRARRTRSNHAPLPGSRPFGAPGVVWAAVGIPLGEGVAKVPNVPKGFQQGRHGVGQGLMAVVGGLRTEYDTKAPCSFTVLNQRQRTFVPAASPSGGPPPSGGAIRANRFRMAAHSRFSAFSSSVSSADVVGTRRACL